MANNARQEADIGLSIFSGEFERLKADANLLFQRFHRSTVEVDLDYRELIVEETLLSIYESKRDDYSTLEEAGQRLEEAFRDAIQKVRKLPPGGAFLKYPKRMSERAKRKVQLGIGKGNFELLDTRKIGETIIKHLPQPAAFDKLEGKLDGLNVDILPLTGSEMILRDGADWLSWKWEIQPKGSKDVTLSVTLTSLDEKNLALYRKSVWPKFRNPDVAIEVFKDLRSIGELLLSLLINRIVITALGSIFTIWLLIELGLRLPK